MVFNPIALKKAKMYTILAFLSAVGLRYKSPCGSAIKVHVVLPPLSRLPDCFPGWPNRPGNTGQPPFQREKEIPELLPLKVYLFTVFLQLQDRVFLSS